GVVAVHGAARDGSRGRTATHPLEVPARGWKDVLFRVWKNIGKDRVLLVGAGVTFERRHGWRSSPTATSGALARAKWHNAAEAPGLPGLLFVPPTFLKF